MRPGKAPPDEPSGASPCRLTRQTRIFESHSLPSFPYHYFFERSFFRESHLYKGRLVARPRHSWACRYDERHAADPCEREALRRAGPPAPGSDKPGAGHSGLGKRDHRGERFYDASSSNPDGLRELSSPPGNHHRNPGGYPREPG